MDFIAEYLRVIYYWDKVEGLQLEDHNRFIEIRCQINEDGFNYVEWLKENELEDDLKKWLEEQDLLCYHDRIVEK